MHSQHTSDTTNTREQLHDSDGARLSSPSTQCAGATPPATAVLLYVKLSRSTVEDLSWCMCVLRGPSAISDLRTHEA